MSVELLKRPASSLSQKMAEVRASAFAKQNASLDARTLPGKSAVFASLS
jgi:hypothetical protein